MTRIVRSWIETQTAALRRRSMRTSDQSLDVLELDPGIENEVVLEQLRALGYIQ